MNPDLFKERTKQLGISVISLVSSLPQERASDVIGRQVIRSATSVGANYRAACRAESPDDMLHCLKVVEEEADETLYWLEVLRDTGLAGPERLAKLMDEANQILAMTVASIRTLRRRTHRQPTGRSGKSSPDNQS